MAAMTAGAFPETFIAVPASAARYTPQNVQPHREVFLGRYGEFDVFAYAFRGGSVFVDPAKVEATDWFGFWMVNDNGKIVQQHHLNPVEASDTQFLSWVKSAKAVARKLGLFRVAREK